MDDCPVEFREKVVVSPLRLIGATFLLTAVVSFVMILPLAFLAKTNKYIPGFAIYLIFSFAIFSNPSCRNFSFSRNQYVWSNNI